MNNVPTASAPLEPARYYSVGQIAVAAMIGSPPAAGHLLAANFRLFGMNGYASRCVLWGWLSLFPLLFVSYVLPEKFPALVIPLVYTIAIRKFAERFQGERIVAAFESGATARSNWQVAMVSVGVLALALSLMLAGTLLIERFVDTA